jgi:hypothetical protein
MAVGQAPFAGASLGSVLDAILYAEPRRQRVTIRAPRRRSRA